MSTRKLPTWLIPRGLTSKRKTSVDPADTVTSGVEPKSSFFKSNPPVDSFPTFMKIKPQLDGLGILLPTLEPLPGNITDVTVGLFTKDGIFTGLCYVAPNNIQSIGGRLHSDTILISDDADKLMFKILIKTGNPKEVEWNIYPDMTERILSTNRQIITRGTPRNREFIPKPPLGSRVLIQVMDGQGNVVSEHYNRVWHKESLTLFRGIEQFYPLFLNANPTYSIHETYIEVDDKLDGLACELIQACTDIARVDPSNGPTRTPWGHWVRIYIDNLIIYPWMSCVPRKSFSPIVILKQFHSPDGTYVGQLSKTIDIAIKIAKQFLDPLHDIITAFELLKSLISVSGSMMLETIVNLADIQLETIKKQQEIYKNRQDLAKFQQNYDTNPKPLLKVRIEELSQRVETKQQELIRLQEKLDTEQHSFNDTIKSSDHDIDVDEYADDFDNLKGVSTQEVNLDSPLKSVSTQGLSLDSPLKGVFKETKPSNFMLFLSELDVPTSKTLKPEKLDEIASPKNFQQFLEEVSKYNKITAEDMFRGPANETELSKKLSNPSFRPTGSKIGGKTRKVKRTRNRKQYKRKSRR